MKRARIKNVKPKNPEGFTHYKKTGGGSLRLPNKIIKPNEEFWAKKEDIPKSFLSSLIVLEEPSGGESQIQREKEEPEYKLELRSVGWYDVVDSNGKVINEKAMRKAEADELLNNL